MVKTIYSIDALSFNSQFSIKQIFETDTTTSFAKVLVKKKGTQLSYLQITPEDGDKELLYCNDSAWVVDHQMEKLEFIGTGAESLNHNSMSNFFSFTIFGIDSLITQVEPFWSVIDQTKDHTVVSVAMTNNSPDLSDIRAEFTCGNADHMLYEALQEVVYMKADKLYQQQIFSDYRFPQADQLRIPEYFSIYDKDLGKVQKSDTISENNPVVMSKDIFLENIELFDFKGNRFYLPEEGLILFDLWYVGCAPCMKSAPVLEKLYESYKDKVYFFSVNEVDSDTAKIDRFCDKMGITFPVLLGGKEKIGTRVCDGGYPVFILMEAETGKVLWTITGYTENLEEIISEALDENLK